MKGDFGLVARQNFHEGKNLSLHWRGPRRVTIDKNPYAYQVEDLRNGQLSEVYVTHLKFYTDSSLDPTAKVLHVLSSETSWQVWGLLRLLDAADGDRVLYQWQGAFHLKIALSRWLRCTKMCQCF